MLNTGSDERKHGESRPSKEVKEQAIDFYKQYYQSLKRYKRLNLRILGVAVVKDKYKSKYNKAKQFPFQEHL